MAEHHDLTIALVESLEDKDKHVFNSDWVLLGRRGAMDAWLDDEPEAKRVPGSGDEPVWTDDFTNILSVLE